MQMPRGGEDPFLSFSVYTQGKGGLWVKLTKARIKAGAERMMMDANERDTQKFVKHLQESAIGVSAAAAWLNRLGYTTVIPPSKVLDHYKNRNSFSDSGDLFIQQRVEVKHRSLHFTCAEDWPMGDSIIVCAAHSFDSASPKPLSYLILNADMTYLASIPTSTRPHWTVQNIADKRYENMSQLAYLCPVKLAKFFKM